MDHPFKINDSRQRISFYQHARNPAVRLRLNDKVEARMTNEGRLPYSLVIRHFLRLRLRQPGERLIAGVENAPQAVEARDVDDFATHFGRAN
jgi:hypothetical protein